VLDKQATTLPRRDFIKAFVAGAGAMLAAEKLEAAMLDRHARDHDEHAFKLERWKPTQPLMPARPTLLDFFTHKRFRRSANHCLQSARRAQQHGDDEEIVFACLIHDLALDLHGCDHGYWAAQLFEPYVSERVAWAVRHHQALRFFADPAAGYEYPELYKTIFGPDFVPEPYLQEAYRTARQHRWYMYARRVTVHDDYSPHHGDLNEILSFSDIVGRHFKQPAEGLGYDNSPTAHMWRTLINPSRPL
jgi:hypothetical protein